MGWGEEFDPTCIFQFKACLKNYPDSARDLYAGVHITQDIEGPDGILLVSAKSNYEFAVVGGTGRAGPPRGIGVRRDLFHAWQYSGV